MLTLGAQKFRTGRPWLHRETLPPKEPERRRKAGRQAEQVRDHYCKQLFIGVALTASHAKGGGGLLALLG